MGNARTGSGHLCKMDQWEAFELCSPEVREALNNSLTVFYTVAIWKYERKHGTAATLRWIALGNRNEAKRPLIKARGVKSRPGYKPAVPSSFVDCGVKPLYG